MNNLFFGLGCVSFVIFFVLFFYNIHIKDVEDNSYKILEYISSILILFLFLFKFKNIFNVEGIKWVSICSTFIFIISALIYIRYFMFGPIYDIKLKYLFFAITVITFITVINTLTLLLKKDEIVKMAESNYEDIIKIIFYIASILVFLFFSIYYIKIRLLISEFRYSQRYSRYNNFEKNLLKNGFSKSDLLKIEKAIVRLYFMSQDKMPSTLDVLRTLKKAKISSDFLHVIVERLYSKEFIKRCSVMTLIEFQQELLPEIFTTRRAYRSSSMDMRYYEDFIERINFAFKKDNRALDELSQKMDSIYQYIEKNLSLNFNDSGSSETYGCQNQIRELFHALETPIATSEMAISNLVVSFDTLNDMQRDNLAKFKIISNSLNLFFLHTGN